MRLFLLIIPVIILVLIQWPIRFFLWLYHKKNPERADQLYYACLHHGCRIVLFFGGIKISLKGEEILNRPETVLYVGNHRSIFDIVIFLALHKEPAAFISKVENHKVPILGKWMDLIHCLYLDRDNLRQGLKTILAGIEVLKSGLSVMIFPEGTRNKDANISTLLEFHGGSFKLAEKSGVPIVPVVLCNTADIFENHLPWVKAVTINATVMEPIRIESLEPEQKKFLGPYVQGLMQEELNRLAGKAG